MQKLGLGWSTHNTIHWWCTSYRIVHLKPINVINQCNSNKDNKNKNELTDVETEALKKFSVIYSGSK